MPPASGCRVPRCSETFRRCAPRISTRPSPRLARSTEQSSPDAEGTGTTLVTAGSGIPLLTSFGARSYARHVELGCVPLEISDDSSLRHDVDTAAQLEVAAERGLGPRTAALLAAQSSR